VNYTGDGTTCVGVDACDTVNGGCDVNAICTPEGAGVASCACNTGYSGDGMTCMPIDSCVPTSDCDPNATCTMSGPGTNSCVCNIGYSGDGMSCTPANPCATNNGGCLPGSFCLGSPGGPVECGCVFFPGIVPPGVMCPTCFPGEFGPGCL